MAQYTGPEGLNRWRKEFLDTDPEWQKYLQQGRVPDLSYSQGSKQESDYAAIKADFLRRVREEDNRVAQLFELYQGRTPTQSEIDSYSKWASDPAMLNAAIAQKAAKAPASGEYSTAIDSAIQAKLGRAATDAEKQYFGKQMEAGNLDPYTLNTYIENTNEYQTKISDTARAKLATELQGVDTAYMGDVEKALQRQYTAQGRSGSSAFGSALIKAGQDLAKGRTEYLAGLGYQDFLRGQGNLRSDYEGALASRYAGQQQQAALGQESRNRYYAQQDFDRQLAAQKELMALQEPKKGSFLEGLIPGLVQTGGNLASAYITKGAYQPYTTPKGPGTLTNSNPKLNLWG